jgi:DNA-binding transcriptional MerR regulator
MSNHLLKRLNISHPRLDTMPDRDVFIIGELAEIVGFEPKTIRFYEKTGLLSPARQGKFRIFRKEDVERLLAIKALRSLGMPIKSIRRMLEPSSDTQQGVAERILQEHLALLQKDRDELGDRIVAMARLVTSEGTVPA